MFLWFVVVRYLSVLLISFNIELLEHELMYAQDLSCNSEEYECILDISRSNVILSLYCTQLGNARTEIQVSRIKIALLLPIKHSIINITVIPTWNINTRSNTAVHYHGSKGSWKSCGIYGSLSVSHIASIFQQGCKGCNRKSWGTETIKIHPKGKLWMFIVINWERIECQKLRKIFIDLTYKLLTGIVAIGMLSKQSCLQHRANFHRFRAW